MVDNPPVQANPPDPPEESGPKEGSDEWKVVQSTQDKRREFGAGVAFPTGSKIRHFVLEFRFKEKLDEAVADGSTLNLHGLHREFVEKLMAHTGDAQLIPTAKDKKNSAKTTPHPIIAINNFPTSDRLHKLFFNRTIYYDKYNKRTVVRIFHAVLMKETVFAVKQKIFDWLSQKNLWMLAGELDSVETSGIGWMLGAHPFLVFTPDIAERMNFLISRLPKTLIEEKVALHGSVEDLEKLPLLFVNPRDQGFGAPPGRVVTKAATISCVINRTRLMKDLISSIPKPDLPYMYIPIGLPTMEGPEVYMKLICINNDRQNEVQGINVKGFSDELFSCYTDETKKQTVMDYFMGQPSIASVQRTLQTAENGKFIFIVYTAGYNEAKALIQEFCENKFKLIYVTQQQRDDYRVAIKSHPHLVTAALPGGATAEHGKYLVEMLKKEETQKGQQYATTSAGTWAAKVKPKFTFDPSSEHPNAAKNTSTTTTTITAVPDNTSIVSINSGSTLAPTALINSSGQTVVSQDLSSIVSQMQSMQSEQTKILQTLIEKQDKQARRQARDQREAAAAAQRANENMMTMVVELIREFRGGGQRRQPKKKIIVKGIKKRGPQIQNKAHSKKPDKEQQEIDDKGNIEDDIQELTAADETGQERNTTQNRNKKRAPEADDGIDLNSDDDDLGSATQAGSAADEEDSLGEGDDDGDEVDDDEYGDEEEEYDEEEDYEDGDSANGSGASGDESDGHSVESNVTPPARNQKQKETPPAVPKKAAEPSAGGERVQEATKTKNRSDKQDGYQDTKRLDSYFQPARLKKNRARMTTEEARNHSKITVAARKLALSERAATKIALRQMAQEVAMESIATPPSPDPSTPDAKRERTRQRSPGGTPDNDVKLQRTGTAPQAPTTHDEIARALDYESQEVVFTDAEEPNIDGVANPSI